MQIFYSKKILLLTLPIVLALSLSPIVKVKSDFNMPDNTGSTFSDLQSQLNQNLSKQSSLQKQINGAQNQEKTLSNQIALMNDQISLTGLQIDETQNRIAQLAIDIADTENKLTDTQKDLDEKTDLANNRIRSVYEEGERKPLELFLQSEGFNDFLLLQKYSEAIHDQDVKMITSITELKETYTAQKTDLANQQKSAQDLKAQLDTQQTNLANQKAQQSGLLESTKNSEQLYQQQLAQVKLDQQAIQNALLNLGTRLGPVKRGDIIAFQGNTGCVIPAPTPGNPTAGSHVHFGYLINGKVVNPQPYLNNGTLGWPLVNPRITQPFGANAGSALYGAQGHPAIDMTVSFGAPIYAAQSGTAYLSSDNGCGNNPMHPKGWGITVDHGDGTKTIYWHIQH